MGEFSTACKRAELYLRQLEAMREDVRQITSLEGIAAFVQMFNRRLHEIQQLLALDPEVSQSVEFLEPLRPDIQESEYPSAIIDGKRGIFMVNSGVLLSALRDFIRLHGGS